jgi:hypothetical protein
MLKLKIVIVRCHDEQDEIKVIIIIIINSSKLILDVSGKFLNFRPGIDYNCGNDFNCNVTYDRNLAEQVSKQECKLKCFAVKKMLISIL